MQLLFRKSLTSNQISMRHLFSTIALTLLTGFTLNAKPVDEPTARLAAMNFYRAGDLNITYAIVVASAFVLGGYFGSKMSLALKDSVHIVKLVFGSVMLYAALRMIWAAVKVMIAK